MTEEKNGKTKPKGNKKERRSQKQLNLVKKRGEQIVSIAGAIIILSSIKWVTDDTSMQLRLVRLDCCVNVLLMQMVSGYVSMYLRFF